MKELTVKRNKIPYEAAEEMKSLRSTINLSGVDKKVIMITSCFSDEGKSSLSLELAWSMAEIGKRVLVIDTDLRRSKMANKVSKGTIEYGLTNYLAGHIDITECFYRDVENNIYIIPAGDTPPNPAELLTTKQIKTLIEKCREVYDYIIVDTSPIGLVSDCMPIASFCDTSILLLQQGRVSRKFAKETLEKLQGLNCPVLGAIINKYDRKKDGYKYYGKYGKYEQYYKK
ncbi:MAG: CpsD/CapB family tyrosine-protein kinase [Clostridia bacterium]